MITGSRTKAAVMMRDMPEVESDRDLLKRVYDAYATGLFRYARALVGSSEDAEDAVQEVFIRIARNAGRVAHISDLRRYLLKATRNAAYQILRSRQRRQRLEEDAARELACCLVASPEPDVEAILQAFSELPPEQREVLALKIFQELTFKEIAQVIGKSQNTAMSRYRYAVERIRVAVNGE